MRRADRQRALDQVRAHRQAVRRVMPPPAKVFRDKRRREQRRLTEDD